MKRSSESRVGELEVMQDPADYYTLTPTSNAISSGSENYYRIAPEHKVMLFFQIVESSTADCIFNSKTAATYPVDRHNIMTSKTSHE